MSTTPPPFDDNMSLVQKIGVSPPYATGVLALLLLVLCALSLGIFGPLFGSIVLVFSVVAMFIAVRFLFPRNNPHLSPEENFRFSIAISWLLERHAKLSDGDPVMAEIIEEHGNLPSISDLPREAALAVIQRAEDLGLEINLREDPLRPGHYI